MYAHGIARAWLRSALMAKATQTPLAQSPGLGPKSAALLARAGVRTQQDLAAHDAAALYLQLKTMSKTVSLNMLWGLVSAQTGVPWQQVAREQRSEWLVRVAALADAQRQIRTKPTAPRV
jgi:DNA transformation protein and related proteins